MTAFEEITDVRPDGTVVISRPEFKPGDKVKVIVLTRDEPRGAQGKLSQNWAGGLSDISPQYTSVELQHKAQEWR